jgi:hypothetical protein
VQHGIDTEKPLLLRIHLPTESIPGGEKYESECVDIPWRGSQEVMKIPLRSEQK